MADLESTIAKLKEFEAFLEDTPEVTTERYPPEYRVMFEQYMRDAKKLHFQAALKVSGYLNKLKDLEALQTEVRDLGQPDPEVERGAERPQVVVGQIYHSKADANAYVRVMSLTTRDQGVDVSLAHCTREGKLELRNRYLLPLVYLKNYYSLVGMSDWREVDPL